MIISNFLARFLVVYEMLGQTPEKQGTKGHIAKWAIASYFRKAFVVVVDHFWRIKSWKSSLEPTRFSISKLVR